MHVVGNFDRDTVKALSEPPSGSLCNFIGPV